MKPCMEYLELMNAVLDGEATPVQHEALSAHLAQCPACAALYEGGIGAACLDDGFGFFAASNVSGVYSYFIHACINCGKRNFVVKMNIRNERQGNSAAL